MPINKEQQTEVWLVSEYFDMIVFNVRISKCNLCESSKLVSSDQRVDLYANLININVFLDYYMYN